MGRPWFILADDLTGAADSAIAFARRRVPSIVTWGEEPPDFHADAVVIAYDAATRELDAASAARRHRAVSQRLARSQARVFKKMDSTLRGHPACEIAAMLDVILAHEPATRIVLAPSFPAMGRTVRAAQVYVNGVPLQFTEFWREGNDPALANLVHLLESAGLPAWNVSLDAMRADAGAVAAALAKTGSATIAVCDAETEGDLERLAEACLADDQPALFIGSAGLAHALARCVSRAGTLRAVSHRCEPSTHGALIVVGSRAQASRAALKPAATLPGAQSFSIEPAMLAGDVQAGRQVAWTERIGELLRAGIDVVADIAPSGDPLGAANPKLVSMCAGLLAPAARHASALVATGGETASALLARLGVDGIRLLDEIEPGIPLGLTLGTVSVPVVTKAGGFGDEECLKRIISRLRFIKQTGTVA